MDDYLERFHPIIQLRWNARVEVNSKAKVLNMGEAKGTTFDRVLIYPTGGMLKWVFNHKQDLSQETRSKFYVALTRARYSVGIVCNKKKVTTEIAGVQKYER